MGEREGEDEGERESERDSEETQKHAHTQSQIALQQLFFFVVFINTL